MQKKAISPVVATALLLVVAVVAVVGFQSWFTTYQSGVNVKVEQNSKAGSALTVERLETTTNGQIWIKNSGVDAVNVTSWKVVKDGSPLCSDSAASGSEFNITGNSVINLTGGAACSPALQSGQAYDVVLVSSTGVFASTQIAR